MKKLLGVFVAILILCVIGTANFASAQLITIGIEATVTSFSDSNNLLQGKVAVGSIITGTYTYDTNTPDTNPATYAGLYRHYSPPYGLQLSVGGFTFMSDPNNTEFSVGIANNNQGLDNYGVGSTYNLPLFNGVEVDVIYWQLDDYSGTVLSSTDLPTTPPVLSDWDYNSLIINGPGCSSDYFYISAQVTSAVLIPEPVSLLLLGIGLLAIRKHKKEV
jgi:hypothetical protein